MLRIASYNVENLFARPKALNVADWSTGRPVLAAYEEVNKLLSSDTYTAINKTNEVRRVRDRKPRRVRDVRDSASDPGVDADILTVLESDRSSPSLAQTVG